MYRALIICSLVTLLVEGLFVITRFQAPQIVSIIQVERSMQRGSWGEEPSNLILLRALDWAKPQAQDEPRHSKEDPFTSALSRGTNGITLSAVYKSAEALRVLALLRISGWMQWLPISLVLLVPCAVDGAVSRKVKAKEFRQHHPELFVLSLSVLIALPFLLAITALLPLPLWPNVALVPYLLMAAATRGAISNFHKSA
ncbi:DUF4400 domain-containing protein [Massilia arenosa]|uniref:DUF4400 domain-containing protein n=1 Tax=Zemynaea arenosa TaxID=2561931 RepID=A0A4Y9S0B9_9BURK|nr:DUF4400 domain-containing protein [Massilia arenosa]TFW13379.1 DUF4400 domain-containing protein [Massilia arenosa]